MTKGTRGTPLLTTLQSNRRKRSGPARGGRAILSAMESCCMRDSDGIRTRGRGRGGRGGDI